MSILDSFLEHNRTSYRALEPISQLHKLNKDVPIPIASHRDIQIVVSSQVNCKVIP